ncbi:Rqc2 family fibronectin-binding protein [Marinisporobacter balticus]|uniref:Rqc2 homolog RqcH n=1 Tax=Marinisporobacter balticus TaxID=2018667 RepID=A0A4R2KWR3_9FIRM|nr:NFACT RNA binding domain-containing protein [Marinisporobacter balticus]TCO78971.1 putative ribosome quality control (RQC) complex YloA/Tae2 family protein [Marinisporobacter balticus]
MPFDGMVVSAIVHELRGKISKGKIEKIYQPEADEINLFIRCFKEKYNLLLSASSKHPRMHLTNGDKVNPQSPPMFCMLLRKHLQGGRILDIQQKEFERIIEIDIESYDELGYMRIKKLVIEIMGKHSNIILLDPSTNKILDSIKRISADLNRYREILPGKSYVAPPNQGKVDPTFLNFEEFVATIKDTSFETPIYKAIYASIQGISPIASREICFRANIHDDATLFNLSDENSKELWQSFKGFIHATQDLFYPNIIVSKEDDHVIDFYSVSLKMYQSIYGSNVSDSMSNVLEEYYIKRDLFDRLKQKSTDLRKLVTHTLNKLSNKKQKLRKELISAQKSQNYRIYGELLTANLYLIEKDAHEIEVINFYDPTAAPVIIPLDTNLTPAQNAQKYFKRYTKSKNAEKEKQLQLEETDNEIHYFENLLHTIESAWSLADIEEIRSELVEEGYIKKKRNLSSKKKKKDISSKPLSFISSDGFQIMVGKNNKQNDQLTLKTASKKDLWFHTKDLPGSHVIIFCKNDKVPESTILEAAELAAFHSKGKMSSNVPIDYTFVKNVKKPSGAKPGMVIYENNKTIYITPRANIVEILNRANPS